MRWRSGSSVSRRASRSANESISYGFTTKPVSPSCTSSRPPPKHVVTGTAPAAMPSRFTVGNESNDTDGDTTTSASRYAAINSPPSSQPPSTIWSLRSGLSRSIRSV